MSKQVEKLSAAKVEKAGPGRYSDGNGLYLVVKPSGWRSWIFRYVKGSKLTELGLGGAGKGGFAPPLGIADRNTSARS